jgi:ABC-type multidrug transport system fused ATPase/permease subunit
MTSAFVLKFSALLGKVFIGVVSMLLLTQATASANPFDSINDILNIVDDANRVLDRTNTTIDRTSGSVDRLFDTLNLSPDTVNTSVSGENSIDQVLRIYEAWYGTLTPNDKETVAWLVMQHARSQTMTFETLSSSEWFLQKPVDEQMQVGNVFFKLQQIIDETVNERERFLAFAFCVNSGQQSCTP